MEVNKVGFSVLGCCRCGLRGFGSEAGSCVGSRAVGVVVGYGLLARVGSVVDLEGPYEGACEV